MVFSCFSRVHCSFVYIFVVLKCQRELKRIKQLFKQFLNGTKLPAKKQDKPFIEEIVLKEDARSRKKS